jgi:UDP-N-acetylglucosamine 4,6-dehydratase
MLKNKIVLITGGTGSFGGAILNFFLRSQVKEVRIFSRDEKKQEDMRILLNNEKIKFYIGDVRNYDSIYFATKDVDYIFHAAALKQVPSCEFYPLEAIRTNVFGAENVINAAIENKVKKIIVLSTDKAVYPINAMGLSKAMMEKIMIAKSRYLSSDDTILCGTRYGNVMASRGSVIPLFVSQIKASKPITITNPKMTRFLMSLDDSVNLVNFSLNTAKQGDLFIQKSPATTIENLAKALFIIFKKNSQIKILGTRHGEKLYESLLSREEMARAEDIGAYYRVPSDIRDLNYSKYSTSGDNNLLDIEDYNSHNATRLSAEDVAELLLRLDYIKEQLINV